ncbi:hypothetical protein ILYODFUR_011111 [Ilyodon furcidens]|uniref:Uncharacterized protein n=1 Tax=Ilyodon furcidens TaxID=33524 RepID=A0ABV0V355_9TELE
MVKHQPLQVYERQLCLSCITGIYGCRWKRYQRSHDDTTKWLPRRVPVLLLRMDLGSSGGDVILGRFFKHSGLYHLQWIPCALVLVTSSGHSVSA